MKIVDLLPPGALAADLAAREKDEALRELASVAAKVNGRLKLDEIVRVLQERERLGSTGIGDGVAIPHGKLRNLDQLLICFGRSRKGVDFDSMDGKPAHLFFLLIAPEDAAGVHLKTLARISKLLKNPEVRRRLIEAEGGEELYRIIADEDDRI